MDDAASPLRQLADAILAAKSCRIQTALDVKGGGTVDFVATRFPSGNGAKVTAHAVFHPKQGREKIEELKVADVESAFRAFAAKYPDAVPRLATISASFQQGTMTPARLKMVIEQAWAEALGRPIPSDEDLARRRKDELAAERAKAGDFAALLATGKAGVTQFNERPASERITISLEKAKLVGLDLDGIRFGCANLKSADLTGSSLRHSAFGERLSGGHLAKARFVDCNLEGTDLHSCWATGADFTRANLSGAVAHFCQFDKCRLVDARLDDADLKQANLRDADLTGASLEGTLLEGAYFNEKTGWPEGFKPGPELNWAGKGGDPRLKPTEQEKLKTRPVDFPEFVDRLKKVSDASKLDKALSMLKADRFRLFARVEADHVTGVVKSQSDASLVYSCRLGADGAYSCCTQNLNVCGGLRGSPCKHLLVLILGLTQAGELDLATAHDWSQSARGQKPALDKDAMAETLLQFKGAEAGEVDWRPTETIPEDFYAM